MGDKAYMKEYRQKYPDKVKESVKGWRERNPSAKKAGAKATYYKATFGLTVEQVDVLIAKQNGVCAVCGNAETFIGNGGKVRGLCVDHCHATGTIRGMLCSACNGLLGHARGNQATLQAAIQYLRSADTGYKVAPSVIIDANKLLEAMLKDS